MVNSVSELYEFSRLLLDKYQAPHFIQDEFAKFYNYGLLDWIKYKINNFEKDEVNIEDLRTLNEEVVLPVINTKITRPKDLYVIWSSIVTIKRLLCGKDFTEDRPCIPFKSDTFGSFIDDPFNRPSYTKPRYRLSKDYIYFDAGFNVTILSAKLFYLKYPKNVKFNGSTFEPDVLELPYHCYNSILKVILSKMLENIESPRLKSFLEENQINSSLII